MSQFRYIRLTVSKASSSLSASISTIRLNISFTSILYFLIRRAKLRKISDNNAIRSKLNKYDHKRSNELKLHYCTLNINCVKIQDGFFLQHFLNVLRLVQNLHVVQETDAKELFTIDFGRHWRPFCQGEIIVRYKFSCVVQCPYSANRKRRGIRKSTSFIFQSPIDSGP